MRAKLAPEKKMPARWQASTDDFDCPQPYNVVIEPEGEALIGGVNAPPLPKEPLPQ